MKRKRFVDGTTVLESLDGVTGLRITKVNAAGCNAFRVLALPSEDIVYWSFSRHKVNRFARGKAEELARPIELGAQLAKYPLDYDFGYSPGAYVIGAIVFGLMGFYGLITASAPTPSILLLGVSLFTLFQGFRASKYLNASQ
ncbi:hypothetical protein [Marinobacter sp. NFXS9]|uniref:hypothetical protein n=1 Tax=Marinobacter sp. NFXS9 TaxID=2818433 RepID=UPI0032DF32D9